MRSALAVAAFVLGLVVVVAGASLADTAAEKLGADFEKAAPAEKLALLSIARADKTLSYQDSAREVDAVATAETAKGKTSEEQLKLLGALRADAQAKLKEVNEKRKAEKKQGVSFAEPDHNLQLALALVYVSDTAGAKPTIESLGCLKQVRDATEWSATCKLTLAFVEEALQRDEKYRAADMKGKLDYVATQIAARGLLSDLERTYVENAVLAEWMSAELKAGKKAADLAAEVKALASAKKVCFFSASWADGILKRVTK